MAAQALAKARMTGLDSTVTEITALQTIVSLR